MADGRAVFAVLLFQDIAVVPMLAQGSVRVAECTLRETKLRVACSLTCQTEQLRW